MVHNNCRCRLLRFEQESRGQADSNILFRMKERKQLGLVLQIWARGISERVPRSPVLLMEQIPDVRRVIAGDAHFLAHELVMKLGEGFRSFYAESVEVEIFCVFPALEQALGFLRSLRADGHQRKA